MHNVLNSNAAYPVLMRRPWNAEATGIMSVNSYDEFLKLVEIIASGYSAVREQYTLEKNGVVVLVGPSGSGKNEIADELLRQVPSFEKLVSYTTDKTVTGRPDGRYHYLSEDEFRAASDKNEFFETTTYAHHSYGSRKADVEKILAEDKNVLTVMDICGAMALKTHFPNVITIYVKRDRKELITAILNKECTTEDKANRLLSISGEGRNQQICDYTVRFEDCGTAVENIRKKLCV